MEFTHGLYLTHYNLAYFAQALLALVALAYLLTVKHKTRATWFLTLVFGMLALFLGGFWYAYSGFFTWFRNGILVGSIICGVWTQAFMVCFVYEFPEPDPGLRREARLAMVFAGLASIFGSGGGVAAILEWETRQQVTPRFMALVLITLMIFAGNNLWGGVVLCRRTLRLATNRQAVWWRRLFLPQGRSAQALRAYLLICCAGLTPILFRLAEQAGTMPNTLSEIISALAPLIIIFFLISVYFTYAPEPSTVMIKIVGASLTLLLSVIAFTGFWLGNAEQAQYQPEFPFRAETTLRFEPQPAGGYAVARRESSFDANLGVDIAAQTSPRPALALGFPFPFQGTTWPAALISPHGSLTLTNETAPRPISPYLDLDILRLTPKEPAIVPLFLKLSAAPDGGVFFAAHPTHATMTWQRMHASNLGVYTFQVRLFASGVIEMTYATLPDSFRYDAANPRYAPILTGILPGGADATVPVQLLRAADPVATVSDAFCWYYYTGFRVTLHRQIAPLYVIMMIASLIVLLVLPLYFHSFLLQPLYRLRDGVQQMETGRLDVALDVASFDELGALTQTFNRMASSMAAAAEFLQEDNRMLEQRVADRTKKLSETLAHLQVTQQELIQSEKMAALGKLIANIAHEINTPLGAIRASTVNIANALTETTQKLPPLLRALPADQYEQFCALLARATQPKPALTSREERAYRHAVERELEAAGIANADSIADTFVDMGIYADVTPTLTLLQSEQVSSMLQAAYHLAAQHHHSANILAAVERVSKIVFALKSYAHSDASGEATSARVTDGLDVVLTLYYNQLKQGIEVVKQYADTPPIRCYPDELNQVWTNLIHNAIQAMQGKGRLEIAVSQHQPTPNPSQEGNSRIAQSQEGNSRIAQSQEGNSSVASSSSDPLLGGAGGGLGVVVAITDSGHGIPDAIKGRIFEPFFTTKPAGEGSGLGLDICKKILDKHQGKIEFESQPGRTTFRVFLPVNLAPEATL